jgi:hypothetical protein
MNNAIGYNGNVSMDPKFTHNPLGSVVPNRIVLGVTEVAQTAQSMGLPAWNTLNQAQQKMVAARALQNRGTQLSNAQANQVLISNPAFQAVQIIWDAAAL